MRARHIYYVLKNLETLLGYQVYRHRLGTPQSDDVLIYEETDNNFYIGLGKSRDASLVTIAHEHSTKSGLSYVDADNVAGGLKTFFPIKDNHEYQVMKSYSPYDNVKGMDYPHMLVTTALHDSQVQYYEPAKWVAKLRAHKTDNNLLLFNVNMDAGHGGASGRFKRAQETGLEFAFLLEALVRHKREYSWRKINHWDSRRQPPW